MQLKTLIAYNRKWK